MIKWHHLVLISPIWSLVAQLQHSLVSHVAIESSMLKTSLGCFIKPKNHHTFLHHVHFDAFQQLEHI